MSCKLKKGFDAFDLTRKIMKKKWLIFFRPSMSSTVLWAAQLDFFCSHVLLIPDARDLKRRDPVALLHLLAERMHIRCPFNNIWDATNSMFLGDKRFKAIFFHHPKKRSPNKTKNHMLYNRSPSLPTKIDFALEPQILKSCR